MERSLLTAEQRDGLVSQMSRWDPLLPATLFPEERIDRQAVKHMIDNDFMAVTIKVEHLNKVFKSLDFDLTTASAPCGMKDFSVNKKDFMCLFSGRMFISAKRPSENQLYKIQSLLFERGHSFTRAYSLKKVEQYRGRRRKRNHTPGDESTYLEPITKYFSMGTLLVPFNDVYDALMESKIRTVRVYIPYNRKQDLANFRSQLGAVFSDERPLYHSDTVADFGITWRVPKMFVFGLLPTDRIKAIKVHSMHMSAGKEAGSLEFQFTNPELSGVRACIYPEIARFVKASKRCAHTAVMTREALANQGKGQEIIAHLLLMMLKNNDLRRIQGYRIEYHIENAPNIFEQVRVLQDLDLFSWRGLEEYLGTEIQRMEISKDFFRLASALIPLAKKNLWTEKGMPREVHRLRMIEMWHFYGLHSYWQQRSEQIRTNLANWAERPLRRSSDSNENECNEEELDPDMLSVPSEAREEMDRCIKLRRAGNGGKVTVSLIQNKGSPWTYYEKKGSLYLAILNEWGDSWKDHVLLKNVR